MADTVINPSGGTAAFFEINLSAWLKLQKESGHLGYTSRIFIFYFLKGNQLQSKIRESALWVCYIILIKVYMIHTLSRESCDLILSILNWVGVIPVNFLN